MRGFSDSLIICGIASVLCVYHTDICGIEWVMLLYHLEKGGAVKGWGIRYWFLRIPGLIRYIQETILLDKSFTK